jgi:histidyl-tRNA synthetase
VTDLLTGGPGLSPETAKQVLRLAEIATTDASFADQVRALGVQHEILDEGLQRLTQIMTAANEHAPGLLLADLKIARGLDYYTGTVYETQLIGDESYGSICSGGRYDSLASDGKTTYPGVGISIGVSRLVHRLLGKGLVKGTRSTPTAVLVALNAEEDRAEAMRTAVQLRSRGIPVEVAPAAAKFGKQIRFADRRGIPFVWFSTDNGPEVKDIRSGEQVPADPATWTPPTADLLPRIETPQENQ